METNGDAKRDLAIAELAEAAPWIDTPPSPSWWAPVGGFLVGSLVFVLGERDNLHAAAFAALAFLLAALTGAWVGIGISHAGATPRLRGAPHEFVPVIWSYLASIAVVAIVAVVVYLTTSAWIAAAVTTVGFFAVLTLYERGWRTAAKRLRARLS